MIRELLAGWERFMHERGTLDPLIRMAAGHYQFEAIRPFTDGNGRTGRALNRLFLIQEGLLLLPILCLSRYIIRNRSAYYERLIDVTRNAAWEPWMLYMLEAVRETAQWTLAKIEAIHKLADTTSDRLRDRFPKIHTRELVEQLFVQPYCRIDNLVQAGVARRQPASRYLKLLADMGVLEARNSDWIQPYWSSVNTGAATLQWRFWRDTTGSKRPAHGAQLLEAGDQRRFP